MDLSQRTSYQIQNHTVYGVPIGNPQAVRMGMSTRTGFLVAGAGCVGADVYFVAPIRRSDTHVTTRLQ